MAEVCVYRCGYHPCWHEKVDVPLPSRPALLWEALCDAWGALLGRCEARWERRAPRVQALLQRR